MREYSTPLTIEIPTTGNLTDDIVRNAVEHPDAVVFGRRSARGWEDVTAATFLHEVRAVAKGLVAAGIEPGDRVGIMSRTRYEWTLFDYAVWCAGAVSVPVYETSSVEQVSWILGDSGARAVVAETDAHVSKVEECRSGLPELRSVWTLEDGAVDALVAAGSQIEDDEVERRRNKSRPDSLATLVYTSGTTGRPKGCMLTHGNFMTELDTAVRELPELFEAEDASTLLFLPLAHVFARIIQVGAIKGRVRLGHSASVSMLLDDLQTFSPTFILAVPRVFEKVFNTASQRAAAGGRGPIFDRAARTAIAYSQALERGRPGLALRARHRIFDKLVYARLRAALGGRCQFAVSGGAPLGERLGHFFRGIGVSVLEGYGLTETTAAATANLPRAGKMGTVGRPLPGVGVRTADDGELMLKGPQVFAGYWHNDEATGEVLGPDGWLRTGDLGEIDEEGFVRITGRKKEIIVTAGGKNVVPSLLEDRLRAHPLVGECMVVGDGQPFVGALVTIDRESFALWLERHGKSGEVADHVTDPDLLTDVEAAVAAANEAVSRAEAIRKFEILPDEWTEEAGHLTPSLKLKRRVVTREFKHEVDRLYER